MNAKTILNDQMTLEEKLEAIDKAMAQMQENTNKERVNAGLPAVNLDPADLTMCEGCQ